MVTLSPPSSFQQSPSIGNGNLNIPTSADHYASSQTAYIHTLDIDIHLANVPLQQHLHIAPRYHINLENLQGISLFEIALYSSPSSFPLKLLNLSTLYA
jgi:hypothetical protein